MHDLVSRLLDDYEQGDMTRRQLVASVAALAAAAVGAPAAGATRDDVAAPKPTFLGTDINHVALRVTDLARSEAFYERHLGLESRGVSARSCFLDCPKHDFLALFKAEKPGLDHFCFSIKGYDPAAAVKRLEAAGLEPKRRQNRVYFDDPDGIELQVAEAW